MPDNTPTIPSTDPAVKAATDPSKLTIPQFASEIRRRKPGYDSLSDDVLVREVLARRPDYTKYIQTAEARPKLKRQDRTPNIDQQFRKSTQKFFENHPLLREAALGAASGLGLPESTHPITDLRKGVWHTLTDAPQTPDEKSFMDVLGKSGVLTLPAYRIIKGIIQQTYGYGQEAFNGIDWNQLKFKVDDSGRQAGAEQTIHGLAGLATMIVGVLAGAKKAPEAGEAVARVGERVATKVPEAITVTAQRAAGTGPALAEKTIRSATEDIAKHNAAELERHAAATEKHAAATEKVIESNAAADADYRTKVDRINEDFDQKIADARQKHADDIAARDKKIAELQGQHAEKVAAARADWVKKAYESKQAGQRSANVAARREALEHGQKAYTKLVDENVKSTHTQVRGDLDARWNALREKVGVDRPVEAPPLYQAVESAREMLKGVPADLKIFNDIVKEITEKGENVETEAGEIKPVPKASIPFDDARTQYSVIGEKAYSAEGNLRRALFTLYDAYDRALTATTDAAGAGKEYAALKSDWKQYMQDWHDTSSESTGGSPLAKLYRAVDDPIVSAKVLGKFGDRLIHTFARYDKYGASPTLMSKLRNFNAAEKALPKTVKVPGMPERLSPPVAPEEPPPVSSVEPAIAGIEAERAKKLNRTAEDRPAAKPLPAHPSAPDLRKQLTLDEAVQRVRGAKKEGAEKAAESAKTLGRYDIVLAGLSAMGVVGLHNIAYALPYTVSRFGEMALVSSDIGQRWLSRVTPQDIAKINEVLAKAPEERGPVSQAVTNGLIAKAKRGQPLPPLSVFQSLLDKAQIGAILRVVAPPPPQTQAAQTAQTVQ